MTITENNNIKNQTVRTNLQNTAFKHWVLGQAVVTFDLRPSDPTT